MKVKNSILIPETPLEAVNSLETFLASSLDDPEFVKYPERFLYDHFKLCKKEIKKMELHEKEKLIILDALSRAKNSKEAGLYQKLGRLWI